MARRSCVIVSNPITTRGRVQHQHKKRQKKISLYVDFSADLSAYQGKEVVIAFRYVSDTNYAPQWEIKNFTVKQATTTAVSNTKAEESSATKILRDGQIFILRGDKTYTLQGQELK